MSVIPLKADIVILDANLAIMSRASLTRCGMRRERTELGMIEVKRIGNKDPLEFEVIVHEGESDSRHHVTMTRQTYEGLTAGKCTPEHCLKGAFQFLLDHEPKESILARFDVTVISRYFPEFERELPRYLSQS